jgi:hypothetical protein
MQKEFRNSHGMLKKVGRENTKEEESQIQGE